MAVCFPQTSVSCRMLLLWLIDETVDYIAARFPGSRSPLQ